MELDIINYLRSDEELIRLLQGDNITPLFTTEIDKPSLVYNFTAIERNHVNQSQIELKIICDDYDYSKIIENRINKLLAFREDDPYKIYRTTKFKSYLSGGGCLYREDLSLGMYENTLIYIINWRCIGWIEMK